MSDTSPFHAGEQAVQERMGVREQIEPWARRVVRAHLPDDHRAFYAGLPFLVVAVRDRDDRPWATLLAGAPGFIDTPDDRTLSIDAALAPGDALEGSLSENADVGMLGIEFATRRRNRVNGRIASGAGDQLEISVDQSFGNCPQYIQPREWSAAPADRRPRSDRSSRLNEDAVRWIENADTFFIASGHREPGEAEFFGMDASHRGGEPGFVRVESGAKGQKDALTFPDFAGNNHFNTIGNLVVDPRVALLFVDFEQGGMLQITGTATIDWESDAVARVPGALRLVTVAVDEVVRLEDALPIRWRSDGESIRSLTVAEKRKESDDVTSFVLQARDGGTLPDFEPGQHLPLEAAISGQERRTLRTYSLSAAPNGASYRISIKRDPEGQVSRFLHDEVSEGDYLSARLPAGDFVLKPGSRPVVLVSAGVGVTPMLSMLEALGQEEGHRPVYFVHGARDGDHHPLKGEVRDSVVGKPETFVHVSYSRPGSRDVVGRDYDRRGRIDVALLEKLIPGLEADFYFCGPVAFMGELMSALAARGVPDVQLMSETFGA